jgi:hypothetical protein
MASDAPRKIHDAHPDFVHQVESRLRGFTEAKPIRCLSLSLQHCWVAVPEWREQAINNSNLIDMLLTKSGQCPADPASCVTDALRALAKTDEQRQKVMDAGLLDKLIDIMNSLQPATDFQKACNLTAIFLGWVDKYPPFVEFFFDVPFFYIHIN